MQRTIQRRLLTIIVLAFGARVLFLFAVSLPLLYIGTGLAMYASLAVTVERLLRPAKPDRRFLSPFWNCVSFCVLMFLLTWWYSTRHASLLAGLP